MATQPRDLTEADLYVLSPSDLVDALNWYRSEQTRIKNRNVLTADDYEALSHLRHMETMATRSLQAANLKSEQAMHRMMAGE